MAADLKEQMKVEGQTESLLSNRSVRGDELCAVFRFSVCVKSWMESKPAAL
jgi:hypothetical protein